MEALVVQPDGKIVAAGSADGRFALARYVPDGSLDTSFGTGGIVSGSAGAAEALVLQPDGKLVAAGWSQPSASGDAQLVRYNPDGSVDPTFGTNGVASSTVLWVSDTRHAFDLQSDGKLVVAGTSRRTRASESPSNYRFAVTRFMTNGVVDTAFGTGGVVETATGTGNSRAGAVAIQDDGKIVVAGTAQVGQKVRFAVVRYLPGGTLDARFGKPTTTIGRATAVSGVALQPDGKIVVVGTTYSCVLSGGWCDCSGFALARYTN